PSVPNRYLPAFPTRRSSDLRELSVALRVNHQPGQVRAKDLNDVVVISRPGRTMEIWDFLGVSSAPQPVAKQQASPKVVSLTSSIDRKSTRLNSSHGSNTDAA